MYEIKYYNKIVSANYIIYYNDHRWFVYIENNSSTKTSLQQFGNIIVWGRKMTSGNNKGYLLGFPAGSYVWEKL